ncbi:MAG: hypothetical protein WAV28_19055 [Sedimentisphaerales bacterium]
MAQEMRFFGPSASLRASFLSPQNDSPRFQQSNRPPKKINGFRIVRIEIATVAFGSFAMALWVHFLLHTP